MSDFDQQQTEERNPVEALGEEFLSRVREGDTVTVQDYVNEYPELAAEIRKQFPMMLALESLKTGGLSSGGPPALDVQAPEELGDYRIISEIGRGGMGVVYEAEQQSLRRRVAVKVFPRPAQRDTRQLERFRMEAQTTARLHHSNIVPVFGVGQDQGVHYFVMQRIEGVGLDKVEIYEGDGEHAVCEGDKTQPRIAQVGPVQADMEPEASPQRGEDHNGNEIGRASTPSKYSMHGDEFRRIAGIGIQVAHALAYAHENGVLHRDIKPSNLILDGNGTVWVTDFGLATMLRHKSDTSATDLAGTLRFMAPEQLTSRHDARSDLYSLGVTLYELLVGQPAFQGVSRARLVSRITKSEFVRPRDVRQDIPRDLEAVVLKAMENDPASRYQTGSELADDLQRFLDARPVHARKIGLVSRTLLWMRRSPVVASLSSVLLVGAFASLVLISWNWRDAVAERHRAEGNLSLAVESMDQILERLTASWMPYHSDSIGEPQLETVSDAELQVSISSHSTAVLQDALRYYDRFAADNATNPRLQRATAKAHRRMADIYQRLGQHHLAVASYTKSLSVLKTLDDKNDVSLVLEEAGTLNQLGSSLNAISDFQRAIVTLWQARNVLVREPYVNDPHCQAELVITYRTLGQSQSILAGGNEAKESHREAILISEQLVSLFPDNPNYRLELARTYRSYFPIAARKSRDESTRIKAAGIKILQDLISNHPNAPDYQCELSELLTTVRYGRRGPKGDPEHVEMVQQAIKIARKLTQTHASIPRYRAVLARSLIVLAELKEDSDPDHAVSLHAESTEIYRSLAREFSTTPVYHLFLAMSLRDQAKSLLVIGKAAESLECCEEGIAEQEAFSKLRSSSRFVGWVLAGLHDEKADALKALGKLGEAEHARMEAKRIRQW